MNTLVAVIALVPTVHVKVDGEGYMRFVRDGRTVYAKEATLTIVDGKIASKEGPLLNPRVQAPSDTTELALDLNGNIKCVTPSGEKTVGKIVLALFPDDVRLVVDSGFLVSSFRPTMSDAGVGTAGVIRSVGSEGTAVVNVVAPSTSTGIEVRLKDAAVVDKSTFLLGDIADVVADEATKKRLESQEVSTTPVLGSTYKLTQDMVRTRLLRYGKESESYKFSGANQVTVSRSGQDVTQDAFLAAAIAAAQKELGAGIELAGSSVGVPMTAPTGKLELIGESVTTSGTIVSVKVAVLVDGSRFNSRTIQLQKSDALSKMKVGQTVKLIVKSGAAIVETSGRIRTIDSTRGIVTVTSATGAELSGRATGPDTIEVIL